MSSSKEIGIIVMGLTGAGKSAYISRLTEQNVAIGHSLRSCTTNVFGYPHRRPNGERVWLIDTPGFDDTNKANPSILREIVSFLCAFGNDEKLMIGGLLYVHRITDIRMAGSSLASLRIFEALCGDSCFGDVTVVTTMWDTLQTQAAKDQAHEREITLQNEENFFGRLKSKGAVFTRSFKDGLSDSIVIDAIAARQKPVTLAVQKEMMSSLSIRLSDTTVGRFLHGNLQLARQRLEKRLAQVEAHSRDDMDDNEELIADIRQQISQLAGDPECLIVTYEDLKKERGIKLEADLAQDIERNLDTTKTAKELELEHKLERMKQDNESLHHDQRQWNETRKRELAQHNTQIQDLVEALAYEKAQRDNRNKKIGLLDFFLGRTAKAPLTNNEDIPSAHGEVKEIKPRESRRSRSKKPKQHDRRALDVATRASIPYSAVGHAFPAATNPGVAQVPTYEGSPAYEYSAMTATTSIPQNHTRDGALLDNGGFDANVSVDPKKLKRNYTLPSSLPITRTIPLYEEQHNQPRF